MARPVVSKRTLAIATLVAIIIVDVLAIGLVFPLLPSLFFGAHAPFANITANPKNLDFCYSLNIFHPVLLAKCGSMV